MLGFAAGVMISASFWSLLLPSIEMSKNHSVAPWIPAAAGFLMGAICLGVIDKILPHLHIGFPIEESEGIKTSWRRSTLLILSVALHNIPEGLAIGVAFGAIASGTSTEMPIAAITLTIGIAIHNFPEGFVISAPLRREGLSRFKSFCYGQLSAAVEPIFAVIGASAVLLAQSILPYALAFAAGAMVFVVIEELIPESQRNANSDLATGGAILGFLVMMIVGV